ncbi:MAG: methyltransferase domain-containing protein [Defluviitaleaceae bacterium]|nr:methyltransferase domain-containing protein [Defluviitaleaceae bacterium]MCL2218003.1 methyltransferase domain-containing protein [Defluviitaleaceae bacterium]
MICEHFGRCGGCAYLDISYEDELTLKKNALVECLGEYGFLVKSLKPSPLPVGYRNKMELAFGDESKDGRLALGMRKKRSYYEVATPLDCVLIPDDFKKIIEYVLEYFREAGEAFFHRKRHIGALRHLVLRHGAFTGEILINLSATSALQAPLEPFVQGLTSLPLAGKIVGILHSVNDGVADAVKNENVRLLWGRDYFYEEICGLRFKVAAHAFFQTNSSAAEVLYEIVKDYAAEGNFNPKRLSIIDESGFLSAISDPERRIKFPSAANSTAYDLYCGTGTIAQIIAPLFERVVGIELVEDAILSAKDNAKLNFITNCEFHAGDVFDVLRNLPGTRPGVIVVDPPRDGLHPKALSQISALASPRLIYVACKPSSLARDLVLLAKAGYTPVKIDAVDMFPRTPHVECCALLRLADT